MGCRILFVGLFLALAPAFLRPAKAQVKTTAAEIKSGRVVLPANSPQLALIKTAPVTTAQMPIDGVVAPGRIEFDATRVARIIMPITGRIDQVLVHLGDSIKAGDPLIEIDSPEAQTALSEWRHAAATVNQAKSAVKKATADLERLSDLLAHQAVAKKEVLVAENDLEQARGNLEQSEAALESARKHLQILGLDPAVPGQKVQVRAPISGKIIEVAVTPGEYRTNISDPVLTLADMSQVWITSEVPEKAIRLVEVGEQIQVTLVAYPGETFNARVSRIADTVDPKTRTVRVQAVLPNPRARLRPEMFGTIHHTHSLQSVLVIPTQAVVRSGSDTLVFVELEQGVFEKTHVRLGTPFDEVVPVLSGLKPGLRVVVNGTMLLMGIQGR